MATVSLNYNDTCLHVLANGSHEGRYILAHNPGSADARILWMPRDGGTDELPQSWLTVDLPRTYPETADHAEADAYGDLRAILNGEGWRDYVLNANLDCYTWSEFAAHLLGGYLTPLQVAEVGERTSRWMNELNDPPYIARTRYSWGYYETWEGKLLPHLVDDLFVWA